MTNHQFHTLIFKSLNFNKLILVTPKYIKLLKMADAPIHSLLSDMDSS